MGDQKMVADFLHVQTPDPDGKVRFREFYRAFKQQPGTERISKTRFLHLLLQSRANLKQEGKRLFVLGLSVDPNTGPASPASKRVRTKELRLCTKCGRACEGSYSLVCEACQVNQWVAAGVKGATHRHTMFRRTVGMAV